MNIAFQLLKERVSPEAKRHKLEYDKKYESSPERVKYREELNRERRRRGIYGSHDHKDISHTEGGKLTLEGEHENRARHFKDKGTLRELWVVTYLTFLKIHFTKNEVTKIVTLLIGTTLNILVV